MHVATAQKRGWWGRMVTAVNAGVTAYRHFNDSPVNVQGGAVASQWDWFGLLWQHYANTVFDPWADTSPQSLGAAIVNAAHAGTRWSTYKSNYQLYRHTRPIYSPVHRLCSFWSNTVYPGVLSLDGQQLPDGVPLAIPLADDTPPALAAAIAQWWSWANWQSLMRVYVLYGAIAGSVLVEVQDELDRGKVTARVWWPSNVADLTLDSSGNVKYFALEYPLTADDGTPYTYRKEVDGDTFRTYKDGELYDYTEDGTGAEWPNPYGFVPAVWAKHTDIGTDYGAPAIGASLGKVNELNSVAAHAHDHIHRLVNNDRVLWDGGGTGSPKQGTGKRGPTDEFSSTEGNTREELGIFHGPLGGHVESLAGNVPLGDVMTYIDKLLGEIEQDHPELGLYTELRSMSTLTGPAASRVMGDVAGNYYGVCAGYDMNVRKIQQMCVAIGGFRANSGDWERPLTRQQEKFLPYSLDSYAKGDLDHDVKPRPLIIPTERELLEMQLLRNSVEQPPTTTVSEKA
jgi:hypothetical protein